MGMGKGSTDYCILSLPCETLDETVIGRTRIRVASIPGTTANFRGFRHTPAVDVLLVLHRAGLSVLSVPCLGTGLAAGLWWCVCLAVQGALLTSIELSRTVKGRTLSVFSPYPLRILQRDVFFLRAPAGRPSQVSALTQPLPSFFARCRNAVTGSREFGT